jgi:glycerophosphoryl diester phosphodiesterase
MLVLSHRGRRAGHAFPDNTVDAIDAALRTGCDGAEIDVRRTADGLAVLWHDRHAPDGRLVSQVKRAELAALAGHDVATLDAVLARFDGAYFDVELKSPDVLAAATDALLHADPKRLVVTSFRHDLIAACAAKLPLPCGIILGHRPVSPSAAAWQSFVASDRVRTIVWEFEALDGTVLESATAAGFRHMAWGAVTASDCRSAASLGLAAVIVEK